MEKSNVTVFEIFTKRIAGEKDGKKYDFLAYHTYDKQAKKVTVKFTQSVTKAPKERCFIKVDNANWNLDKSSRFPTLWVKEIEEIVNISYQNKNVQDFSNEDLPF